MLIDTIKNITPEGGGIESKLLGKIVKGSFKEILEYVVKGTIQPIVHGKIMLELEDGLFGDAKPFDDDEAESIVMTEDTEETK